MAVEVTTDFSGPFTPDGVATAFPFDFVALSADEVAVLRLSPLGAQTILSGYSIALEDDGTGTVNFALAPAAGDPIYIASNPNFEQQVTFANQGAFSPKSLGRALDRAAVRDIALHAMISRAVLAPPTETLGALPPVATRAGMFMAFDAGGNAVAASGTGADAGLRTDLATNTGAAMVGFQHPSSGSVARTIKAAILDRGASVMDFGAIPGDITKKAANNAAFAAAFAVGSPIFIPNGDFYLSPGLNFPSGLDLYGESVGGATGTGTPPPTEARLIFDGTGAAGITTDSVNGIQHGSILNVVIDTTDSAQIDRLFDLWGVLDYRFENLRIENRWASGGGFRSRQIGTNPTWLNTLDNVQIRLPDGGSGRPLDVDWSDSWVKGGSYTGGIGSIYRGPGNFYSIGAQWERAAAAAFGLTLLKATAFNGGIYLLGGSIDQNFGVGLKIDLSSSPSGTAYPVVIATAFRNPGVSADIAIVAHASTTIEGILINGSTFTETVPVPWTNTDATKAPVLVGINSYQGATNKRFATVNLGSTSKHDPLTVAQLPTGAQGMRAIVTDANSTTFLAAVAGGGSNKVPVFHDGSGWKIG